MIRGVKQGSRALKVADRFVIAAVREREGCLRTVTNLSPDYYKLISISLNGLLSETVGYFGAAILHSHGLSVSHAKS